MKVNFNKVELRDLDGEVTIVDIAKSLGNLIYTETADIGEAELAKRIYKEGEIEVGLEAAEILLRYVNRDTTKVVFRDALVPKFKEIIAELI